MLYSCTRMATVGIEGLTPAGHDSFILHDQDLHSDNPQLHKFTNLKSNNNSNFCIMLDVITWLSC